MLKSPQGNFNIPPIVKGLILQGIIIAIQLANLGLWAWIHSAFPLNDPARVAAVNFVGVDQTHPEPSVWSIFLALYPQSVAGVLAQAQYRITRDIIRRQQFNFLENISRLIGDISFGTAVAVAVVFFLRTTEITVAQVRLTLKTANLEVIVAIGFILGFFHEDTRRLLKTIFRSTVVIDKDETGISLKSNDLG